MNKELVSIITPLYNSEKFIRETIDSVLNQTYENWEMIIVDDCSQDNGADIVREYVKKDKRIKYIKLEKNSGAAVARNKGIEIAEGRFVAFLDSDDLWYENKLEKQVSYMLKNNMEVTYHSYELIDEDSIKKNIKIEALSEPLTYNRYLLTFPIGCLSAMYDTKLLGKKYFPNVEKREDTALWVELLRNNVNIIGIKECMAMYRISSNSVSSNKFKLIKYQWKLYRDVEKLSILKSLFFLIVISFVKIFGVKEKKY